MTNWFENYEGPKTFCWNRETGKFLCMVGYNVIEDGGTRGMEIRSESASIEEAIREVRSEYWAKVGE